MNFVMFKYQRNKCDLVTDYSCTVAIPDACFVEVSMSSCYFWRRLLFLSPNSVDFAFMYLTFCMSWFL